MKIEKALVIAEPWIGLLLSGEKTWEMRSRMTSHRGWMGLIPKGSGTVVGVARLTDVGKALTTEEMLSSLHRHRIPRELIASGQVARWCVPWKLDEVQPLHQPVAYRHRPGAVTWVTLDPEVQAAIARQLGGARLESDAATPAQSVSLENVTASPALEPKDEKPIPGPTSSVEREAEWRQRITTRFTTFRPPAARRYETDPKAPRLWTRAPAPGFETASELTGSTASRAEGSTPDSPDEPRAGRLLGVILIDDEMRHSPAALARRILAGLTSLRNLPSTMTLSWTHHTWWVSPDRATGTIGDAGLGAADTSGPLWAADFLSLTRSGCGQAYELRLEKNGTALLVHALK